MTAVASQRLSALVVWWQEVQPIVKVRDTARRLVRVHRLRTADALQLGAAIAAALDDPRSLPFVTLDERLALAADAKASQSWNLAPSPEDGGDRTTACAARRCRETSPGR